MIRLDGSTVLLQWATGGLFFLWVTTRHRLVGLGYGWLMRMVFGAVATGSVIAGRFGEADRLRDVAGVGVALATAVVLAISVQRKGAGEVCAEHKVAEERGEDDGGGGGVAVSSLLTMWFIGRRAQAIALSSTGVSMGGAVLVPLETSLIAHGGLRRGAPILGILVAVVALPVLWAVIADTPESMGLHPDGTDEAAASERKRNSAVGLFFTGWALDASGGYTTPFRVLAVVNAVAAIVVSFARLPAVARSSPKAELEPV